MKRICFVTTSPLIVNFFLAPQLLSLRARYEMTLVVNTGDGVPLVPLPGVDVVSLDLQRRWSPFSDLSAVVRLVSLFARRHFDLVHSFSPKAGLLTMLAARLAGVPRRVHTFTGQIWVTGSWPKRVLLKSADRSIARFTRTISSSWWNACVDDTADTEQNSRSVCSASTASAHGIPPNESWVAE